jgi:hypothetical protein
MADASCQRKLKIKVLSSLFSPVGVPGLTDRLPRHAFRNTPYLCNTLLLLLLLLKQTRVGSPDATASLLWSPQGGEWIIAVVNQKTYGDAWGEF